MVTTYLDRFRGSVVADLGKQPCDAATTQAITLAGYQVIDSVALNQDYMRCLVKNQVDETTNGIYVVFSGEWIRASDFSGPNGTVNGQLIAVTGGQNAGLWQVVATNPVLIDGNTPSSITFQVYLLNSNLRTVPPELLVGAAGADSVMFVGFDEFIYSPNAIFGGDGSPQNCAYDKLIKGLPNNQCKGNINYTLEQDLAPCAPVQTAVMWAQWWTVATGASKDMSGLQPAINNILSGNLGSNTWSVNGVSSAAALKLPGLIGGTSDDAAFLAGAQLLTARGYKVGIVPVVIGTDLDVGVQNSSQTTWRGYFTWADATEFTTWVNKYKVFVKHYFDLLNNVGIQIDIIYIGSEMQSLAISSSNAIWALWVAALKNIADYVKAGSPSTKVTYAANWSEYGNGCNFRLDSIWTYPNIDYVGIDWYPPVSITETADQTEIQANLRAGEQMDWTVDQSDDTQRSLATTSHMGKAALAQTAVLPPQSQKNLQGFYFNAHYWSSNGATQAESTPLPGYDRTYNPNGMSVMSAVPAFGLSANLPAASGIYGMYPPAAVNDTWAQFDGSHVAQVTLPTWATNQYWVNLQFNFKITAGSPTTFARLFRIPNVCECLIDIAGGNKVKLAFGNPSTDYLDLCTIDANYHTVSARFDVVNLQVYLSVDGASEVQHSVPDAVAFASAATMYVAGYDTGNNKLQYNLYYLSLNYAVGAAAVTTPTHGGAFYFDEPYCGVRTNWTPQLKPICICEVGFATIGGTACEPNVFPTADYGPPTLTPPDWLGAFTKAKYNSWIALGWSPKNLYGPYGSNFSYDQLGQAVALHATVSWLKSLPFVARVCVYAIDARPAATMLAVYQGSLFYIDGPLYKLSQTINGKLVGGVVNSSDLP